MSDKEQAEELLRADGWEQPHAGSCVWYKGSPSTGGVQQVTLWTNDTFSIRSALPLSKLPALLSPTPPVNARELAKRIMDRAAALSQKRSDQNNAGQWYIVDRNDLWDAIEQELGGTTGE